MQVMTALAVAREALQRKERFGPAAHATEAMQAGRSSFTIPKVCPSLTFLPRISYYFTCWCGDHIVIFLLGVNVTAIPGCD